MDGFDPGSDGLTRRRTDHQFERSDAALMATIPLIELSALPHGRGRQVCKAGLDLAVFRLGDAVYAIEDSCPHAGGPLSNGKLQGTRVSCPVHGLKFNLENVCPPGPPKLEAKNTPYTSWTAW